VRADAKAKAAVEARVAKVKEETAAEAAAPRVSPPVGCMPNLSVECFNPKDWCVAVLDAVNAASHVVCSSYQYDHKGLTDFFLKRLGGRSADFSLVLLVD